MASLYTPLTAQGLGWPQGHAERSASQSAFIMSVVTGGSDTA